MSFFKKTPRLASPSTLLIEANSRLNLWIASFLAGALSALAFAPFDLFFPMVLSVSWFFVLLEKSLGLPRKKVFLLGLFYGIGYFLAGVYWISLSLLADFESFWWLLPFSISFFPLILGSFFGFFALTLAYVLKKYELAEYQKAVLFAGIWLIFELIRGYIFTGFPWNLAGYAIMFSDYAMQSASILGVYGLSFFVVLFALIPVLWKGPRVAAGVLIALFAANLVFGYLRLENAELEGLGKKVRLVQANIKQNLKWVAGEKYDNFEKHLNISKSQGHENVDGFIWSETSIPYPIGFNKWIDLEVEKIISEKGQFLISGALKVKLKNGNVDKAFNSVYFFTKNEMKSYDKHHLVPFGEYVPLQKYLPFVQKITNGSEGFSSGDGPKTLDFEGMKISPLICYEVIFPYNVVESDKRPDLFVNATNDAWFLTSSGPFQHLNMSKMRAVEYGISMARVANTGVTAYIDPYGRIVEKIALNETGYVDVELVKSIKPTFLSHFKYFVLLYILALVVLIFTTLKKPKKNDKTTRKF